MSEKWEILFLNLSPKTVYLSLLDYFDVADSQVTTKLEPSHLELEIGSWLSWRREKGEVRIDILPRNSRSFVRFNFNFKKAYVLTFMIGFMIWVISTISSHVLYDPYLVRAIPWLLFEWLIFAITLGVWIGNVFALFECARKILKTKSNFMNEMRTYLTRIEQVTTENKLLSPTEGPPTGEVEREFEPAMKAKLELEKERTAEMLEDFKEKYEKGEITGMAYEKLKSKYNGRLKEIENKLKAWLDREYLATARSLAKLEEFRALDKIDEETYQRLKREYERKLRKRDRR